MTAPTNRLVIKKVPIRTTIKKKNAIHGIEFSLGILSMPLDAIPYIILEDQENV